MSKSDSYKITNRLLVCLENIVYMQLDRNLNCNTRKHLENRKIDTCCLLKLNILSYRRNGSLQSTHLLIRK